MKLLKKILKITLFLLSPFIIFGLILSILIFLTLPELEKERYFGGKKSDHFDVRGEGLMYPTFSWCDDDKARGIEDCQKSLRLYDVKSQIPILLIKEKDFKPERSMIVRVKDPKNNWYLFGRIIALPNETIKLNGGYVYINNALIDEPYVWKRGTTYGDRTTLNNCSELKLKDNQVFVMGDNRIISMPFDSRGELGVVSIDNITHYLPLKYQKDYYEKRWQELGNKETKKIDLSSEELTEKFVEIINNLRLKKGLSPITSNQNLINAAKLKAKNVVEKKDYRNNNDTSEELEITNAFSLGGEKEDRKSVV